MKTLVFHGCSNTAGREVLKDDPEASDLITRNHTWAKHFHDLLSPGATFVNLARSGASNDSIFRETVEWLANHPSEHENAFVTIMWTEPNRFEFEFLDGSFKDVIAASSHYRSSEEKYLNKFTNEYLANKVLTMARAYNQMLALEGVLRSLNIPFIFCNGFNFSHFFKHHLHRHSAYYKLSSYKGKDLMFADKLSMYQVLKDAGFVHTSGYHFHEDGHKYYAQYLYDKMKDLT